MRRGLEEKAEQREYREITIRGFHVWIALGLLVLLCIFFFFLGRWYESRISSYNPNGLRAERTDHEGNRAGAAGEAEDLGESLTFFDNLPKEDLPDVRSRIGQSIPESADPSGGKQLAGSRTQGPKSYYSVQISAIKDRSSAQKTAEKLKKNGFSAYIIEEKGKSGTIFKVRVGKFAAREEAQEAERKLRKEGYKTWLMKIG